MTKTYAIREEKELAVAKALKNGTKALLICRNEHTFCDINCASDDLIIHAIESPEYIVMVFIKED